MFGAGAVKVENEVLTGLRLEKAPQKTFIGRVERGSSTSWATGSHPRASRWRRLPGSGSSNVRSGFTSKDWGAIRLFPVWSVSATVGPVGEGWSARGGAGLARGHVGGVLCDTGPWP